MPQNSSSRRRAPIKIAITSFVLLVGMQDAIANDPSPLLKIASKHAMQYYLSLPKNWSADKAWPIVVAVEAAEKEFKENARRFAEARKSLPFIIRHAHQCHQWQCRAARPGGVSL